jgi:hypothetical protein
MELFHGGAQNHKGQSNGTSSAGCHQPHNTGAETASQHADSNPPANSRDDMGSTDESSESSWLLNVVICSGRDLFVGQNMAGDLFCMLHTFDGVSRSRTVSKANLNCIFSLSLATWGEFVILDATILSRICLRLLAIRDDHIALIAIILIHG